MKPASRRFVLFFGMAAVMGQLVACNDDVNNSPDAGATGGKSGTATGGVAPTGGSKAAGGSHATGGSPATGGAAATGGAFATGGSSVMNSTLATGGATPTGGSPATGGSSAAAGSSSTPGGASSHTGGGSSIAGASASGGSTATGGASSTAPGGSATTGGAPVTGGAPATGGAPTTGGINAAGGVLAAGGVPATGGTNAAGGVPATGGASSAPDPIDAIVTAYVGNDPPYDCTLDCIHSSTNTCSQFESTDPAYLSLIECIMPPGGYHYNYPNNTGSCYDYSGTDTAVSCYCGLTDTVTCTTTGGIGTCAAQETAAGMTPGTVLTGFTDTTILAGKANAYVNCLSVNCGCFWGDAP